MEEVIKQIREAETAAQKTIEDAEREAAEIAAGVDKEIEALNAEYVRKLKGDALDAYNTAKETVNDLRRSAAERSAAQAEKIKAKAHDAVKPCADLVYNYIVKEFTE